VVDQTPIWTWAQESLKGSGSHFSGPTMDHGTTRGFEYATKYAARAHILSWNPCRLNIYFYAG
jgi:hypothetical protein